MVPKARGRYFLQPSGVQKVSASGFSDLGQSGPTWTFSVDASSSGPHAPKVVRDAARTQTARPELDAARKALATRAASSSKTQCVADPADPTTRSRGEGSMDRRLARRRHHLGLRPRHPVTQHRSIGGFLPPSRSPRQRDSPGRDGSRFEMRRPVGFRPEVQESGPLIFDCRLHPMSHPHAIVPACSTSKTTR